jgi:hypothetical protein
MSALGRAVSYERRRHLQVQGVQAVEVWDGLSQKRVNNWVDSMPERLYGCIELEGQLTGYCHLGYLVLPVN